MNKKIKILWVILSLFMMVACSAEKQSLSNLRVMGDAYAIDTFGELWEKSEKTTIEYKDGKIEGVDFAKFISGFEPVYDNYSVNLRADDGFMINMDMKGLEETYLAYSHYDGWVYVSKKHPVNSGIKNIDEIRITGNSEEKKYDFGLNIISGDKTYNYTIGELYNKNYSIIPFSDGVSNKDYNGEEYTVEVLKEKKIFKLEELVDEEIESFIIMDSSGKYEYFSSPKGYIELRANTLNYIIPEEHNVFTDIKGILVNPPAVSVMDTYYDSLYYLEKDTDVMVLFIDGFSYYQYQKYKSEYSDLNITNYKDAMKANTIYKPVTNSGFAAMITGKSPKENGVLNRDFRELAVDTIFHEVKNLNKKGALIEGDIKILNTEIEPILNLDSNKDGYTDDEVYKTALEEIEKENNFLLVHFHGLDDAGHDYGPNGEKTIERYKVIDKYIGDLAYKWKGKVIITADHGMHSTDDGGSHGEFRTEDMYIPYLIMDGGEVNEDE